MKLSASFFLFFFALTVSVQAQEKTTFQTSGPWKPVTDIRSDLVMVYGANDNRRMTFRERVESWRQRGYTAHFMTGIAWGDYQDYFTGKWDGRWHLDEGQKTMQTKKTRNRIIPAFMRYPPPFSFCRTGCRSNRPPW